MSADIAEKNNAVAPRNAPWTKGVSGNPAGKPVGAVTKNTRLLKDAIMAAAEIAGDRLRARDLIAIKKALKSDEPAELVDAAGLTRYLVHLAEAEPRAFATLMGKVLPMQIGGEFKVEVKDGLSMLMEAVNGRTRSKP